MALAGLMLSWARPIGRLGGSLPCPVYSLKGNLGEPSGLEWRLSSLRAKRLRLSEGAAPASVPLGGFPGGHGAEGRLTWFGCRGRRSRTPLQPAELPWAGWSGTSWGCACPHGTPCACIARSRRGRLCMAGSPGSPPHCLRHVSRSGSSSVGTKAWGTCGSGAPCRRGGAQETRLRVLSVGAGFGQPGWLLLGHFNTPSSNTSPHKAPHVPAFMQKTEGPRFPLSPALHMQTPPF